MNLEDQITQRLKNLNRKQLCKFSWLCGLRVLPFLSAQRGFAYWPENKRQKHLYSIFYALDISVQTVFPYDYIAAGAAADATFAASDMAFAVASATSIDADAEAARAAAEAARAAARAVSTTHNIYTAASAVARSAARSAHSIATFDLESILQQDIEAIKENKLDACNHDIFVYGKLWDNFQEDLKAIGCDYWARFYENLFNNGFDIDKEQLKRHLGVPDEIKAEGAAAVGRYLEGLGDKIERLNEARIIILGEKGAGKTSLVRKLLDINAELPEKKESTKGVDVSVWNLPENTNGSSVITHIWDFAGHVITHSAHRFFLSKRCLYIIVYDGRSERRNFLEYWLNHVKYYGGDSPVFILVNKQDNNTVDIDKYWLMGKYPEQLKPKYPDKEERFFNFSLKDDRQELENFREAIEIFIKKNPAWNKEMPKSWFDVKEKLRKKFLDSKIDFISTEDFNTIANESSIIEDEKIEGMRSALHSLGICLYYENMEGLKPYILNPNWITNGIYKIINWLKDNRKYKIEISRLETVFKDDPGKYPKDKHKFLFSLLERYELAYPYETKVNERTLVLPALLSERQPEPDMENDFPVSHSLCMRYKADTDLPSDTISRFIVKHHHEIISNNGTQTVWRRGVKLKDRFGNVALVIEDSEMREIRVYVKGGKCSNYLAELRRTLNKIFESYKSNYPSLEYAVTNMDRIDYISDKKILLYAKNGLKYLSEKTGQDINMKNVQNRYGVFNNTIIKSDIININVDMNDPVIINGKTGNLVYKPTVAIFDSEINLPAAVDEKQFAQILAMLEKFLKSEQAGDIKTKDTQALQTEVDEARKQGLKGWERLRGFLSDAANIATIGTAISMYLTNHPEIPQAILSMFGH